MVLISKLVGEYHSQLSVLKERLILLAYYEYILTETETLCILNYDPRSLLLSLIFIVHQFFILNKITVKMNFLYMAMF